MPGRIISHNASAWAAGSAPVYLLRGLREARVVARAIARLFSRRFDDIIGGKHVVVVVVSQTAPARRHWVITAYLVGKLGPGEVEWKRS